MKYEGQQVCRSCPPEALLEEGTERLLELPVKYAAWKRKEQLKTALQGSGSGGSGLGTPTLKAGSGWNIHQPPMMKPCAKLLKATPYWHLTLTLAEQRQKKIKYQHLALTLVEQRQKTIQYRHLALKLAEQRQKKIPFWPALGTHIGRAKTEDNQK